MGGEEEIMDELHGLNGYFSLLHALCLMPSSKLLMDYSAVNSRASPRTHTGFAPDGKMMTISIMTIPTKLKRT